MTATGADIDVAVVGAFRSGTNYVQFLLERNFGCRALPDAHGWKHAPIEPPYRDDASVPVVVVAKTPFAFLSSLFRYRVEVDRNIDAPTDWDAFLASPIVITNTREDGSRSYRYDSPVEYWNTLYRNLTQLPPEQLKSALAVYEDVLKAPEAEANRIARELGLPRRAGAFVTPKNKVSRGRAGLIGKLSRMGNRETRKAFAADEYLSGSYLSKFSPAQRDAVRGALDAQVLSRLGIDADALLSEGAA